MPSWVYRESCSCSPGSRRPERRRFFPSYLQASSSSSQISHKCREIRVHRLQKIQKKGKRNKGCELRLCQLAAVQSALALREEKKKNEKEKKRKNVLSSSLESGSDAMRCARRQRLPGRRMRLRACVRVCECRRPSACGCYLYRPLHANGSCETSQTFFPTVTSHQSGRGTRGPEGGRTDGSWSAPSHWSPPPCSRWRPMAHSREGGEEG